ncbi:MAG: TolC family protein [bacterium]
MGKRIIIILFFFGLFYLSGKPLNLNDLIDSALVNNPELNAAKSRYEAENQNSPFNSLMEPMFGIEFSSDMRMYSVSQEIPFLTKLNTRNKIGVLTAKQYLNEYDTKKNEVIKRVKDAYARLYTVQREEEIMSKIKQNLTKIDAIARKNYELNRVSQTDVLHIELAQIKLENELLNIKNEELLTLAELNQILGRAPDAELELSTDIPSESSVVNIDSFYNLARQHSPALKSFKTRISIAKTNLALAHQEYLPDFMLKFEQEEMDFKFSNSKVMIGLTVPLWFWSKQKNMVKRMDAEVRMAQAEYQAMENEVMRMVKEVVLILENQMREIQLYKNSIIPRIEATLKSAIRAYELNKVDIMTVLETQNMLVENELQYYKARAEYFKILAELKRILGREVK